jgi:hypothetical protein
MVDSRESRVWLVRINSKKSTSHFEYFQKELRADGKGRWDKDALNRIQVGDRLGFIVGPVDDATVFVYAVLEEHPASWRHPFWDVKNREVILLGGEPLEFPWNEWRREVGYATTFWPFGTMPARKVPAVLMHLTDLTE